MISASFFEESWSKNLQLDGNLGAKFHAQPPMRPVVLTVSHARGKGPILRRHADDNVG
jgi:hypothetical protein